LGHTGRFLEGLKREAGTQIEGASILKYGAGCISVNEAGLQLEPYVTFES
jgi:hypothetical protein